MLINKAPICGDPTVAVFSLSAVWGWIRLAKDANLANLNPEAMLHCSSLEPRLLETGMPFLSPCLVKASCCSVLHPSSLKWVKQHNFELYWQVIEAFIHLSSMSLENLVNSSGKWLMAFYFTFTRDWLYFIPLPQCLPSGTLLKCYIRKYN